ncbi:glycosyltransferase family 2 protein [Acidovorax sp.]|uniref:glycosyltransferase family 2 protein n=1 Tax=Acidovorax sp. TaxID=1872122 RepID=UPI003BB10383
MKTTLVSIIIVNYNGLNFLEKCINSIKKSFLYHNYEIIIVDNASLDGSCEWLRQRNDIIYIESNTNLGFTGGNNLGAARASGNRLLFINNDTEIITPLDELISIIDDSSVGIVGCRLQYGDLRQQFSFGYEHTPLRIVLSWLGLEKNHKLPRVFRRLETNPVNYLKNQNNLDWVSGACFAIRTEVWKKVNGFDTGFFMYCEDVDLCLRVRKIGLDILYAANCCVIHFEGAGKSWIGELALKRTVQSYQLFLSKHFNKRSAIASSLALALIFLLRSFVFFVQSKSKKDKDEIKIKKSIGFFNAAKFLLGSINKI